MRSATSRQTPDLSAYPDLVVIYLGMRVRTPRGIFSLMRVGPQIAKAGAGRPEGLLHYENNILYSLFPPHVGMRWYWKDFESMERWTRSEPHKAWWKSFLRNSGGTTFWHETYFMRGGMEAVFIDASKPIGLLSFAPAAEARGSMFSARRRAQMTGDAPAQPEGFGEDDLYTGKD
jgi:hypothetical protein